MRSSSGANDLKSQAYSQAIYSFGWTTFTTIGAPICSTRGVIQIVRFNAYPLPVADAIVEQIRRRIEGRLIREPYLKSGDPVVITEGSFSGIEAIFVASDGDERVMLLLNILQSEQTLSFPVDARAQSRQEDMPGVDIENAVNFLNPVRAHVNVLKLS